MAGASDKPLEDVLKNIIGGISKKGGLTQEEVTAAWESAIGKGAARHSKVRLLKDGRLVINMDDSSWLYELTVQKKEILKKLEETLKSKKIKSITLRIGDIK
ncbi:MAG: DUF721 domain-containing protein [Candidatus Omnitrophota bacterium]|nr:DUF721 domain-containing protein [Candidatus Omnitrophota bacterium]